MITEWCLLRKLGRILLRMPENKIRNIKRNLMKKIVSEPSEKHITKLDLGLSNYVDTGRLYPILNGQGGKEQELKYILPEFTTTKIL